MFLVRDVYSGRFNPRAADEPGAGVPRRDISVHVAAETTVAIVTEERGGPATEEADGGGRRGDEEGGGRRSFRSDVVFTLGAVSSRTWHIV